MPQSLNTRWKLPGSPAPYLVVWWYDEEAKDTSRGLSSFAAIRQLERWIVSRRLTLRQIGEALSVGPSSGQSNPWSQESTQQLKRCIAEAFQSGKLVVLRTEPANQAVPADPFKPAVSGNKQGEALPAGAEAHRSERDAGAVSALRNAVSRQSPLTDANSGPLYDLTHYTISPLTQGYTAERAQAWVDQLITKGEITAAEVMGASPDSEAFIFLKTLLCRVGSRKRWNTVLKMKATIGWTPPTEGLVQITIDAAGKAKAELLANTIPDTVPQLTKDQAIKQLTATYKLKVVNKDKEWSSAELSHVVAALALMPSEDRAALNGVELARVRELTDPVAGFFRMGGGLDAGSTVVKNPPSLTLDDDAFANTSTFLGDGQNPRPACFETILHEVGHAVEKLAVRQANEALLAKLIIQNTSSNAYKSQKATYDAEYYKKTSQVNTERWAAIQQQLAINKAAANDVATLKTKVKAKQVSNALIAQLEQAMAGCVKKYRLEKDTALKTVGAQVQLKPERTRYHGAVSSVETELTSYSRRSATNPEDVDDLDEALLKAIIARDAARDALQQAQADDPVLAAFAPVITAQDAWIDAARKAAHARIRTLRLQKFADLVITKKITPFTTYARENWPYEPEEFYAEAYSLWLNEPSFLSAYYKDVYDFFQTKEYRKDPPAPRVG